MKAVCQSAARVLCFSHGLMIGRDRVADWLLAALLRQLVLIFVGENEVCRARLIAGGGRRRFTLGAQTMGVIVGIVSLGHGPTLEALQKA